jgi:mannitol-1-phosphate 5-dehydrogenase
VFQEKDDLLPFEEAKLYGHNATHALAAYVGAVRGVERIADLCKFPGIMRYLRNAFIRESGEALIRKHKAMDPLFTPDGYREYADDLLARMVNPYLHDTVERVGRDCERKLGWDDRLTGTVRLARKEGLAAHRYAMGIAAGLETLNRGNTAAAAVLDALWSGASPDPEERKAVLDLVESASARLRAWRNSGFPDLEAE